MLNINKQAGKLATGILIIAAAAGLLMNSLNSDLVADSKPEFKPEAVRTYYFATDRPGIVTMIGTSDPCYIKRLDGFVKDEIQSQKVDIKGRSVITLKSSLSSLNEVIDGTEQKVKEVRDEL